MQEPLIVEKPALTVVGLEAPFIHGLSPETTNFKVIPPLWEQFLHRAREVPHRMGSAMYGIITALPESERSHPHELQYLAGVAVSAAAMLPPGMISRTVPAGTFVVFVHRGPIRKIAETVTDIYRRWLPQSGYEQAQVADVEFYDQRFHPDREDSEMEYWIGLTPKARS